MACKRLAFEGVHLRMSLFLSIIAVNYEARARGVNRHMRGDDAVRKCPDLNLVRVKELHGKADLSK